MKAMAPAVKTDDIQELYVIPADHGGYTCLGWDVCLDYITRYSTWLGIEAPMPKRGSLGAYEYYSSLVSLIAKQYQETGKRCDVDLIPEFVGREGWRVEIIDKYDDKRRFIIGKSTGWIPIHLEIKRRDSSGGYAVYGAPFKSIKFIEKVR